MHVPPLARELCLRVAEQGGRAYLVGGCVRDHLLGLAPKDIDIEVHGIGDLERLLKPLGSLNAVGKSFGVFKLTRGGLELDVSMPRRDSKVGPGHKGIAVQGDPDMGLDEAVRRRDLTINALMYDPLTDEVVDRVGGLADLEARVLREVDPKTFAEDPLRALRVVQFSARFDFDVAPSLQTLCREAELAELPPERLRGELDKLLMKAPRPSVGLRWLGELGLAEKILPALNPDEDLAKVVDRAAALERSTELMYAALFHRLDPATRADHLDRLRLIEKPTARARLEAALAFGPPSREAWRRLADRADAPLTARLRAAITGEDLAGLLAGLEAAGVAEGPLPVLLGGRELRDLGVAPGPDMGRLQRRVREAQYAGAAEDPEGARTLVRAWLEGDC